MLSLAHEAAQMKNDKDTTTCTYTDLMKMSQDEYKSQMRNYDTAIVSLVKFDVATTGLVDKIQTSLKKASGWAKKGELEKAKKDLGRGPISKSFPNSKPTDSRRGKRDPEWYQEGKQEEVCGGIGETTGDAWVGTIMGRRNTFKIWNKEWGTTFF